MDDLPGRAGPDLAERWGVDVEHVVATESAVLSFGRREGMPVVLKVTAPDEEEGRQGEVLAAFEGRGTVRVLEHAPGAILMERAVPGNSLMDVVLAGRDDQATAILVRTIGSMHPAKPPAGVRTVEALGTAFAADVPVPADLLGRARAMHATLCASQGPARLLHGDLHHENVLFDQARGWLAVDPKGLVGELEYEGGAFLRNPWGRPDLFADPARLRRRLDCLGRELPLDLARVRSWAFVQAVLAWIWGLEDGVDGDALQGCRALAERLQEMP